MKKIVVLLMLLLSFGLTSARAQSGLYFGPKIGMNLSSIHQLSNASTRLRMNFGAFVGYQVSDVVAVQVEALYSLQGATIKDDVATKLSYDYLKVPIMAKLFLIGGLNVEAGVSFDLLISARISDVHNDQALKGINSFNMSIPIGVGILLWDRLDLGLRYDLSLIKNNSPGSVNASNGNLSINVGFRF